jgi:uncharacterized protein
MSARKHGPGAGWSVWGRPLGLLFLILLGPTFLRSTPLSGIARAWTLTLVLLIWVLAMALLLAVLVGSVTAVLGWIEWSVRLWVVYFAPDPEALWLHWARHAHHPETARRCLERAVRLGNAEALFQEGLIFLEGGFGAGGQIAAVERFRKAAGLGHAEAAFRLAEALRTGLGSHRTAASEAETWYRRSAGKGFGPAAAWLAGAYQSGDGVAADADEAELWRKVSQRLEPHQELSRNLLRHDAAPEDPLVRLTSKVNFGIEQGADKLVARRTGRWILAMVAMLTIVLITWVVAVLFWAGSSSLYHLPLIMLAPPLFLLGWETWRLRRGGPPKGRDRLRETAEAGDPEACFQLGLRYRAGGPHLPKDDLGAVLWFRTAAESGHRGAMAALAEAYLGGHGVVRNPREAARWAETACRESTS